MICLFWWIGCNCVSFPQDVFLMIRRHKTTIFTDAKESTTVYELKRIVEGILKRTPEDQRLYKVSHLPRLLDFKLFFPLNNLSYINICSRRCHEVFLTLKFWSIGWPVARGQQNSWWLWIHQSDCQTSGPSYSWSGLSHKWYVQLLIFSLSGSVTLFVLLLPWISVFNFSEITRHRTFIYCGTVFFI